MQPLGRLHGVHRRIPRTSNPSVPNIARLTSLKPAMHLLAPEIDAIPQIAWTATSDGRIERFNQMWYEYVGLRRCAKPGLDHLEREWTAAIHRDDRRSNRLALLDGIAGGKAFTLELRLRRADGVARWFRVTVSPLDLAQKRATRWVAICTDIDDYKRQGQQFAFIAKAGEVLAESLDLRCDARATASDHRSGVRRLGSDRSVRRV